MRKRRKKSLSFMQLINNAAASSYTNNRVYKPRIFVESDLSLFATVTQTRVPSSS
jgi:hypothetical protein